MIPKAIKIFSIIALFTAIVGMSAYLTLTLIVKGEDSVEVPDLTGKDAVVALEILSDLGLNIRVDGSEYDNEIPKNHVLYQDKAAGAQIKRGRDIRIVLSKGPKSILMPNLKGLSVRQAQIILEENGLCLGKKSETYRKSDPIDVVISQRPGPNRLTEKGTCADLLVSLGRPPEWVKMPDLKGQRLEEALMLIESARLALGDIKYTLQNSMPPKTVITQSPLSGYRVGEGSRVYLVLNQGPDRQAAIETGAASGVQLFRYRIPYGFLKRRLRLRMNAYGISDDVVDDFFKPGSELWLLIPGNTGISLFLYEDGHLVESRIFK